MSQVAKVFELDWSKVNLRRGLGLAVVLVVPLVVLSAGGLETYWVSVVFGALFVGLSDPGGSFAYRAPRMAAITVGGALLTALGFGLGDGPWGWVVLAAFVVTLLAGLAVKYGAHRFVGAVLLNVWFVVALALPAAYVADGVDTGAWSQTLAWLVGSALTLAYTGIICLARGRAGQSQPVADLIPGSTTPIALTRELVAFAVIRAVAVAVAVAIAFGLDLAYADWLPVATLAAIQPSLPRSAMRAAQRATGAVIGALVAAVFMLGVNSKTALAVVIVVLAALAGAVRVASYTWYNTVVAAAVLIALDLPHPTNFADEGRRILFTFVGVAIAVLAMLLAGLLAKPTPAAATAADHPG